MLKSWNREHFNKLKGFHLEMTLAAAWPRQQIYYGSPSVPVKYSSIAVAAAALFPALGSRLQYSMSDPAGLGGVADSYLSGEDRLRTCERLDAGGREAAIALRHEERTDHYSAISKWRSIFGDEFPAYS
jgi:hypothetical protein